MPTMVVKTTGTTMMAMSAMTTIAMMLEPFVPLDARARSSAANAVTAFGSTGSVSGELSAVR